MDEEYVAVFRVSKLKSLKAIHNDVEYRLLCGCAVFRVAKLKSLKAIHNINNIREAHQGAVFRVSKLKSLKAIHNGLLFFAIAFIAGFRVAKISEILSSGTSPVCFSRKVYSDMYLSFHSGPHLLKKCRWPDCCISTMNLVPSSPSQRRSSRTLLVSNVNDGISVTPALFLLHNDIFV